MCWRSLSPRRKPNIHTNLWRGCWVSFFNPTYRSKRALIIRNFNKNFSKFNRYWVMDDNSELYSRLLADRIIFLGGAIDDDLARSIVEKMLFLEAEDPNRDIFMYINSPGGSVSAGLDIVETMNQINSDVCTICYGLVAGMGTIILSAGASGKRMSLPDAQMMLSKIFVSSLGKFRDRFSQSLEIMWLTDRMNAILSKATGRSSAEIQTDAERAVCLCAEEAREYGLIDRIVDRSGN
jgi:ATP-dependent Clp protease, protease subunit